MDEKEWMGLQKLFRIYERNSARQNPSTRKLFKDIEKCVLMFGGFTKLAGQVEFLKKNAEKMGESEYYALGFHPKAYALAGAFNNIHARNISAASRPRTRKQNPLRDVVAEIVNDKQGAISFKELMSIIECRYMGSGQVVEVVDFESRAVTLIDTSIPVKFKTIEGWLTKEKKLNQDPELTG